MAQQLRAFDAFAEDPGSDLSTHVRAHSCLLTAAPGDLVPSSSPCEYHFTHAHTHMHIKGLFKTMYIYIYIEFRDIFCLRN